MAHIHTKAGQHDLTASAYVIRTDGQEPRILMHRHKKFGRYLQFGGHVELNETPWQAITHELLEESGYNMAQLKILQPKLRVTKISKGKLHPQPVSVSTHPIEFTSHPHLHTDLSYAFVTHELPKHKIQRGESEDLKLFSRADLVNLPAKDIYEDVREISLFVLDNYLKEWEPVATSRYS